MRKIKVLHVSHAVGGVDVYIRLISKAINPDKFQMIVVHGYTDAEKLYHDKHGNVLQEYKIPIDRNIRPIEDLKSILKLMRVIKKENPNVIHAHSAKGGIIARAAALFFSVKVLYTPHAFSYLSTENKSKRKVFLGIEKLFRFPKVRILATSQSEADRAIKEVGFKKENVIVFDNCIFPISDEQKNKPLPFELPVRFISSVGRPSFQKNIEAMVEVFKQVNEKLPDIHLVLMGVGFYAPNVETVKDLLKRYGLEEKFIMLPWINQEEIFTIIDKSELYISTSKYEGLPYSVIESLALRKACVVSDCDGNRDLVTNDENGFVIKQEDLESEMPKAILKILTNKKLKEEFETNSLERFNKHHNILLRIKDLEKVYMK